MRRGKLKRTQHIDTEIDTDHIRERFIEAVGEPLSPANVEASIFGLGWGTYDGVAAWEQPEFPRDRVEIG
jgi:hypothetical protein